MRVAERVLDVTTTIDDDAERIAMSIDEGALAHIMSVLTDLYSDPEAAIVREYSTNALDAHIQAGESRPIEVTTPSALSPFFRVRDYGEGLSARDIREVFSRYGASTKRDSDDVVGMLGLGCKSALTYADQFTFTSTRDGRTVQVLVSRDADGAGSMSVVSDAPANGTPSGTEITIPTKRDSAVERKAREFFRFWKRGTVLVNGAHPEALSGLWVADNLLLTRDVSADTVVMGNVPYPVPDAHALFQRGGYRGYGSNRHSAVAFVPIGAVQFTPSREALQMTKRTETALDTLAREIKQKRDSAIRAQVHAAKSPAEAIALLAEGRAVGFEGDATYEGRKVPAQLQRGSAAGKKPAVVPTLADSFLCAGSRSHRVNGERYETLPLLDTRNGRGLAGALLFEYFDSKELSPTKRDKLAAWCEAKGLDVAPQVYVEKFTTAERYWLDGSTVYDWREVAEIKLASKTPTAKRDGRPRGSYDAHAYGAHAVVSADEIGEAISDGIPVYWHCAPKYGARHHEALRSGALDVAQAIVVGLPANRVDKFVRDFPQAVELPIAAQRAASDWLARQSDETRAAYSLREYKDKLGRLDAKRVNDPELAAAIVSAKRETTAYAEGLKRFYSWLPQSVTHPVDSTPNPFESYPLLSIAGYGFEASVVEHCYLYVNAAYAAREEG